MLKSQTSNDEHQTHPMDVRVKQCAETLLYLPGLPIKLKRDVQQLLSTNHTINQQDQALRLLHLYQRAMKIFAHNPNLGHQEAPHCGDKALLTQLSDELQHLITELDFEGEAGDLLTDIRSKLLLGVNSQGLLELALQVLKLVIDGTQYERKNSEKFLEQINSSLSKNLQSTRVNLEQSTHYQQHRQHMHQDLLHLVNRGQHALSSQANESNKPVSAVFSEIEALSERLIHAEQREQVLIERMQYTQHQMETLLELTQDYRRRLEDQAQRLLQDPLTKLYNRTAFNDRLELEYRRWIRTQHNLRLVILDIDAFKAINESFGYLAGDKALKVIARTIHKELEKTDTAARFSGEEFILLLPERADNECHQVIQKIQRNVARLPFKFRDKQITITLSAASTHFKEADTPEIVLERLHRSLQEMKPYGPNQLAWK
ncbi:diguanylate cyclase [Vibrio sp. A11]|nr:GGDEF domain family protein [Vibrio metschnikovii CIP 69.14]EKO3911740.1 diguanylate cyclase [Vibrio metschnikovii]MBC5832495.1 diguanylate cyclase [Vibrio metschnikovii]NNN59977.1 diguanylate cyclase [Vibrio sp. A11]NNN84675.1 diguanylate cyclase [Vibrio sp. A8-1]